MKIKSIAIIVLSIAFFAGSVYVAKEMSTNRTAEKFVLKELEKQGFGEITILNHEKATYFFKRARAIGVEYNLEARDKQHQNVKMVAFWNRNSNNVLFFSSEGKRMTFN
jgi:hypothetical protein